MLVMVGITQSGLGSAANSSCVGCSFYGDSGPPGGSDFGFRGTLENSGYAHMFRPSDQAWTTHRGDIMRGTPARNALASRDFREYPETVDCLLAIARFPELGFRRPSKWRGSHLALAQR